MNNNYERPIIYALSVINMAIALINVRLKNLFLIRKDLDVSVVWNMGIIVPIVQINLKRIRKNQSYVKFVMKKGIIGLNVI